MCFIVFPHLLALSAAHSAERCASLLCPEVRLLKLGRPTPRKGCTQVVFSEDTHDLIVYIIFIHIHSIVEWNHAANYSHGVITWPVLWFSDARGVAFSLLPGIEHQLSCLELPQADIVC